MEKRFYLRAVNLDMLCGIGSRMYPFPSDGQLWTCSGLGSETHNSAQYRFVCGQLQLSKKPQQLRGLNRNHSHEMKEIFKGAAARASCGRGPFYDFYAALLAKGMEPEMARLTLARKIAAITLTLWKKEERFGSYGALVTSCAGDGSCETFQPPPSASINPALAVIC